MTNENPKSRQVDRFTNVGVGIIEIAEDQGTVDYTRRPAPEWLLQAMGLKPRTAMEVDVEVVGPPNDASSVSTSDSGIIVIEDDDDRDEPEDGACACPR